MDIIHEHQHSNQGFKDIIQRYITMCGNSQSTTAAYKRQQDAANSAEQDVSFKSFKLNKNTNWNE